MKIELKDENGKLISVDLRKSIYYVTDDMESESNSCFSYSDININNEQQIQTQVLNSDGSAFSITDSEDSLDNITDIDVYIEASHSDTKINSGFYSGDSMLKDSETYILPFGKPMIKNHDSHSEPLGRIVEAQCTDSAFIENVKAMDVKANITDKEAITKFMDGRYKTVSIGANPKTIVCNTCGKHILKDSKFKFCGHWRGETYNEKECTWKLEDLEYTELSVVNKPADRNAQVYKIVVHKKSDKIQNNDNEKEIILDDLTTEILNHEQQNIDDGNNINDEVANVSDNTDENTSNVEGSTDSNLEPNIQEIIDMLNEKIASLSTTIAELQNENTNFRNENIILSIDNENVSLKLEVLTSNLKSISDMYKNDLLSVLSIENEEEKSFSELKSLFKDYLITRSNEVVEEENSEDDNVPTKIKPATNPGLVNNDIKNIIKDEENNQSQEEEIAYNSNSLNSVVDSLVR